LTLRIAVLDHVVERGGGQLAMARLADALRGEVETTFVLPAEGPFVERLRAAGHTVEIVPLGEVRRLKIENIRLLADAAERGPALATSAARMASAARRHGAQLVYSNSLKSHVYGALVSRLARLPHVAHVRDIIQPPYLPPRLCHALRAYFAVFPPKATIANSAATARAAPFWRRSTVIPSGITRAVGTAEGPSGGVPTLAVLGRIERWKGQDVAIRALARLRRRIPNARLLVGGAPEVGDPEYGSELRELTEVLGVTDAVEFTGFVDDPYEFFAQATLAVHSSVMPEPFGQVVVEAMAVGRPVIATAAGGPLEVLEHGRFGLLVPPSDPDAIADAAYRVLTSRELYAQLSAAAVRRAADFTIERSAAKTLAVLNDVAVRKPRAAATFREQPAT
jgi:glycosyltransferase involved in cell wall biosynthesis